MLGLQSIASLSITPWVPYGIGAIAAFWALIFGVWVWIRRREIPKVLLPDLDELADLLEQELSTGKLPSYQLVGKLTEVGAHLNAYRIDCPNFHGLGVCAVEKTRHYISTLSAVYPQHTVAIMA